MYAQDNNSLPVWIILSPAYHYISINSQPFPVGIVSSTFGSEFIAMKTAVEHVEALRYKLWMFSIPMEGPTNIFCDNEAVFKNTSIPDSTLKKKHMSICYHRAREAVAAHTMRLAKEGTATNLANLFTKPLTDSRRAF